MATERWLTAPCPDRSPCLSQEVIDLDCHAHNHPVFCHESEPATHTAAGMPLPPRDLSAVHLSMNPSLSTLHAAYPMSRFVPVLAIFRLCKLMHEGVPLIKLLDTPSWIALACLDDASADYCIGRAIAALAHTPDLAIINATLVQASAPYVVPMMAPLQQPLQQQPPLQQPPLQQPPRQPASKGKGNDLKEPTAKPAIPV